MKFFIAAAGRGTRMNNYFELLPKSLYPYKGFPIIGHLIETYRKYSNDIVVAVSRCEQGMLLRGWLEDYYRTPEWLSFHIQNEPKGTAHLLRSAGLVGEQVCVSWADFVYESNFREVYNSLDGTTFAVADVDCRYSMIDGKISKGDSNKDGLFGFYYFEEMPELDEKHEEFLDNFLNVDVEVVQSDIISLGTEKEFLNNLDGEFTSLKYDVTILDDVVIKKPSSLNDYSSVEPEFSWFIQAPKKLKKHIPEWIEWVTSRQLPKQRLHYKVLYIASSELVSATPWAKSVVREL